MDLEEIKELMAAMEDTGMTKIALKDNNGFELKLERGKGLDTIPYAPPVATVAPQFEPQAQEKLFQKETDAKQPESKEGHEITSPMVGTFYTAASPEADPFVKVGDTVTEETVVGIVEAMKVMNEIKAGKSGVVIEIHVDNAHPVEFGTKLFTLA
ncbi:MAG: acetyl-CoA carboxylase biotin carboxyl carrier protein [Simkaniaceae bacterium]|nr:acetyl-CoA carboxylase biotin carboxyl carrier protein [Simkaniaceae bacterium]